MSTSCWKPALALLSLLILAGLFCAPVLADKTDKAPNLPLDDDLGEGKDGDGQKAEGSERDAAPNQDGKETDDKPAAPGSGPGRADRDGRDGHCPGKDRDGMAWSGKGWRHRLHERGDNPAGALAGLGLLVLGGLSLFALQFLMLLTFPAAVERIKVQAETRRLFAFALGLVNVVFLLLLVSVLGHAGGAGGGLAAIFLFLFLGLALFGLLAKAQHIGAKACALAGTSQNPVVALVFGWWTVFFVSLIPVVGWLLAAYWLVGGVGSVILSLFGGPPRKDGAVEGPGPDPEDSFESPVVNL